MDPASQKEESVFFRRWAQVVLRSRALIALLFLVLSGAAVFSVATQLTSDMTITSFLDKDSKATQVLETYRDYFGRDDAFLILVEGDVFTPEYLNSLKALHGELATFDMELGSLGQRVTDRPGPPVSDAPSSPKKSAPALPEDDAFGDFEDDEFAGFDEGGNDDWSDEQGGTIVDEITSLINVRRTRSEKAILPDGRESISISVGKWMDPWPADDAIENFKGDVLADPLLAGQLVDTTGRYSLIMLRTQFMSETDSELVHNALGEILAKHDRAGFRLMRSGLSSLAAAINQLLLGEIVRLLGLALLAVFVLMFWLFRHPLGVVGPFLIVALSSLWTFGMMAACGLPMTMLSSILPAFIICVGVGDAIHLQSVYRDLRRDGVDNHAAIIQAVAQTGVPILFTTLTTMIGLLSFLFQSIEAVGEMGIAGAFGVGTALLNTLLLMPIVLSFNQTSLLGSRLRKGPDGIDRFLDICASLSGQSLLSGKKPVSANFRRRMTLLVAALLSALAIAGATRLRVWHDPVSWIPDTEETKIATHLIDEHLGGTSNVQLVITAKGPHGMKDLKLLEGLEKLQEHAQAYEDPGTKVHVVGPTTSLLTVIKETNRALHGGDLNYYALPQTQQGVNDALFVFENSGPSELRRLVSADFKTSQMTLRALWMEATSYGPLVHHVESGIEEFIGDLATVETTGASYTLFATVSSLISNLLRSFGIAFVVITLFMMILLRDIRLGLIAMVPNLLPIVYVMGCMGWVGMPVDLTNLLIASIAIGLAVDDTIHFLHRFKVRFDVSQDVEDAIAHSLHHAGRAIVATTIMLCFGFSCYLAGTLVSVQRFGGLIGLTIVLALLVDLIFGPALIRSIYRSKSNPDADIDPREQGGSGDEADHVSAMV